MLKRMLTYLQYITPQLALTQSIGRLAASKTPWVKNKFIHSILKRYPINMQEALDENPANYASFNDFFIRKLKPELRPIAAGEKVVVSPADGAISQLGKINKNLLLQAKQFYFDLETLLGGDKALAQTFYDGNFATIYLAPQDYHRVHMPLAGTLQQTIFVPGKLFSVNKLTSTIVPQLFSRNERLISIFDTSAGKMAVILVGAMIVGSINTVWSHQPARSHQLVTQHYRDVQLDKGAEMGYFNMGSTVIVLFEKNKVAWSPDIGVESNLHFGSAIGKII